MYTLSAIRSVLAVATGANLAVSPANSQRIPTPTSSLTSPATLQARLGANGLFPYLAPMDARAVILAGGAGTRLRPLTDTTNKHLLPVGGRPMIHYPLATLSALGATEIMLVTERVWQKDFESALHNLALHNSINITFEFQTERNGIVGALRAAGDFLNGKPSMVMLGDNLLQIPPLSASEAYFANPRGAEIFYTRVNNPSEFGVAEISEGRVRAIEEKPAHPVSNYAVIGLYFYDSSLVERIRQLKKSARGEYEITDLNNSYIADSQLRGSEVDGWWLDCGSHKNLQTAEKLLVSQPPQYLLSQKTTESERV